MVEAANSCHNEDVVELGSGISSAPYTLHHLDDLLKD
jgi:hypothetical protein